MCAPYPMAPLVVVCVSVCASVCASVSVCLPLLGSTTPPCCQPTLCSHAGLFLCVCLRAGARSATRMATPTWCVSCLCLCLCPSSSQLPCVLSTTDAVYHAGQFLSCRGSARDAHSHTRFPVRLVPVTSLFGASIPASGHRSPPLERRTRSCSAACSAGSDLLHFSVLATAGVLVAPTERSRKVERHHLACG